MVNKRAKLPPTARNVRPLSPEEQKALAQRLMSDPEFVARLNEARAARARGEGISWRELKKQYGRS
jgi:hypothetical protein